MQTDSQAAHIIGWAGQSGAARGVVGIKKHRIGAHLGAIRNGLTQGINDD